MYYVNDHVIKNVVVIGAGGTGSRLLPQLIQFLKTVPIFEQLEYPYVYVFDDDIVENKNLTRQLFIKPDVGYNKASVLADRYEKAYNYPIIDVKCKFQNMFENDSDIKEEMVSAYKKEVLIKGDNPSNVRFDPQDKPNLRFCFTNRYTVYIISVDSVKDRFDIFNMISLISRDFNYMIIDAGNENTFGQVSNFHLKAHTEPTFDNHVKIREIYNRCLERALPESYTTIKDPQIDAIPFPWQLYVGRQESEVSCADLDQTLAVNSLMASGIMVSFQNIALMKPIKVVTTYYNLNGIHTQDILSLESFKVMSDEDLNSLGESGLRGGLATLPSDFYERVHVSNDLDKAGELENLKFALYTVFRSFLSNRNSNALDMLQLKPNFLLMEGTYYEKYIQNGQGFVEYDEVAQYFWFMLDNLHMAPHRLMESVETEIQFTISRNQVASLLALKGDQPYSEIVSRLNDSVPSENPIYNISFRINIVDYLNLVAYYLINSKDDYDMETRYVFSTGLVKGAGIPLLTPNVCEGVPDERNNILRSRPSELRVVNPRYSLMEHDGSGFLDISRGLTRSLVGKIETLLRLTGKYVARNIGFDNLFSYGLINVERQYTNKYLRPSGYSESQISIPLERDEYPEFKRYLKDALKYFFTQLGEQDTSELLESEPEERGIWDASRPYIETTTPTENRNNTEEIEHAVQQAPDGSFMCRASFNIPYDTIQIRFGYTDEIRLGQEIYLELTADDDPVVSPQTQRIGNWLRDNETFRNLINQGYTTLTVVVNTRETHLEVTLFMREPEVQEANDEPILPDDSEEGNDPEETEEGIDRGLDYIQTQVYFSLLEENDLTTISRNNLLERIMNNVRNNPSYRHYRNLGYDVRDVGLTGTTPNLRLRITMDSPQDGVAPSILMVSPEDGENFVDTTNNVPETNLTENINLIHVREYVYRTVREYHDLTLAQMNQIFERVMDNLLEETQFVELIERECHVTDITVTRQEGRFHVNIRLGRLGEPNVRNIRINTPEDELGNEQIGNPDVNYLRDMISRSLEYDATTAVARRDQIRDRLVNHVLNDTQVCNLLHQGHHIMDVSLDRSGNNPNINIRFDIPAENNTINMAIHSDQYPQQEYEPEFQGPFQELPDGEEPHGSEASDEDPETQQEEDHPFDYVVWGREDENTQG